MTDLQIASNASKHLARLVAVQALYEASYEQEAPTAIIKRALDQAHEILNGETEEGEEADAQITECPDPDLLGLIVRGTIEHKETLDEMINGACDQDFTSNRMEVLLKTVLRAGAFELHHHSNIPAGIIISDYVDVTRAFFNAKEPSLVNAVLDRLAKKLRS